VDPFAKILDDLKPRFIHHPECKLLLPELLWKLGYDLDETSFDVPRLRTSTSNDFLGTGISYAFHPHRDTWYSAPQCQTLQGRRVSVLIFAPCISTTSFPRAALPKSIPPVPARVSVIF